MAQGVARVGDTVVGLCNGGGHPASHPYVGTWVTGSGNVLANALGVIRVGDTGTTDCGHHFHASTGSSIGTANGLAIHRVGDAVTVDEGGTGTTTTGSNNVTCL